MNEQPNNLQPARPIGDKKPENMSYSQQYLKQLTLHGLELLKQKYREINEYTIVEMEKEIIFNEFAVDENDPEKDQKKDAEAYASWINEFAGKNLFEVYKNEAMGKGPRYMLRKVRLEKDKFVN